MPAVRAPGLLVMVHELPDELGIQVTALNFGATPVDEPVSIAGVSPGPAVDMLGAEGEEIVSATGVLRIRLDAYAGKSYRMR